MVGGRTVPGSLPPLGEVWEYAQRNLKALPERWRALTVTEEYPVRVSDSLQRLRDDTVNRFHGASQPDAPVPLESVPTGNGHPAHKPE